MSLDLATIGIAMDTSGLDKGTAALNANELAAVKTADAADKASGRYSAFDRVVKSSTDQVKNINSAMGENQKAINAMTEAEKARSSLFDKTLNETKRLLDIAREAASSTTKALADLKIDPDALSVPNAALQSLKTWQEKTASAVGETYANMKDAAASAWETTKNFAEQQIVIWGVAAAVGISAAVLGAVYAAFKGISFAVGLLTGESYKSANIDGLIAANNEVKKLQELLPLTATGASALNQALKAQGMTADEYATSLARVRSATTTNSDELDRLGVKFKDNKGQILSTKETLENAAAVLSTYTQGWDRNQAAQAIGLGTEKQIAAALAVTAGFVAEAKEKLIEYNLVIGEGSQEATKNYEDAMKAFNAEMSLTSQGFSRAIADNIMPALTMFAEFFKDGMPYVVNSFRYSIAVITSLFFGLKTSVYVVTEAILGSFSAAGSVIGGVAQAMMKIMGGDVAGAARALGDGWEGAKKRVNDVGTNIVAQAQANSKAMALAWGADSQNASRTADAVEKLGKAYKPPPKKETAGGESEYAKLNKQIQEQIDLDQKTLDIGRELTEAEKFRTKIINDMNLAKVALTATERKDIEAKLNQVESLAKEVAWQKQANEENKKYYETIDASTKSLREQAKAQQETTDKVGLTSRALQDLEISKLANLASDKLMRAAVMDVIDLTGKEGDLLREQAKLYTDTAAQKTLAFDKGISASMRDNLQALTDETAALTMTNAEREVSIKLREVEKMGIDKASQSYADYAAQIREAVVKKETIDQGIKQQVGMWQTIEGVAKDTFSSIFDSGKNAFTRLKDTLKNGLYALLYDLTVKKWLINISAAVSGNGVAQQAFGASGSVGDIAGGGGGLSSLSSLGSVVSGLSGAVSAFTGAFSSGAAIGTSAFSGGVSMIGSATGTSSLAAGVGQVLGSLGPVGWAAIAAGAVLAFASGRGETRSGATYDTGADGKANYQQGPSGGEINGGAARQAFDGAQQSIRDTLKAVGSKAMLSEFTAGLESSKNGKGFEFAGGKIDGVGFGEYAGRSGGQFGFRSQDGQAAFGNYILQLKQSTIEALQAATDLPKAIADRVKNIDASSLANDAVDKIMSDINAVITAVGGFQAAVKSMPFENLKNLSFDAASGLIAAAGGLDALRSNLDTYYQNFTTQEEQRLRIIKQIDAATAGSGLDAATATRASFKALVDGQDLTTESGQKTYAALLSVSGALAGITPAAETFGKKISDIMQSLLKERGGLDANLLDAKGDGAGASALRRKQATEGFAEAEIAAYDYNRAIEAQTAALNDAKTAQAAIANQRAGLQNELNGLTDTAAQALNRQRDALDDSNRALFDHVQGIKSAAAAQAKAAENARAAAAEALSLATSGASEAFAGLTHAVEKQKADELAVYNAAKLAAEAVYKAQASSLQTGLDGVKSSISAVTESVGRLKSLSSSLKSTLDGLRIIGSEGAYRVDAQAQISGALTTAQAGGGLPLDGQLASALSTISKPSEELFSTFAEYALDFAKTAGDISALSSLTDAQLSADEMALAAYKRQEDLLSEQQKTLKDSFAVQVSGLEGILENAKLQLDAANGINTSVLSVAGALSVFNQSIVTLTNERAKQGLPTIGSSGSFNMADGANGQFVTDLYSRVAGKAVSQIDQQGYSYWLAQVKDKGASQVQGDFENSVRSIRGFAVGTNYVPRDMLAQIHEGEAIVPKAYNPAAAGGNNNSEMIEELRAMRKELAELKELQAQNNDDTRQHARQFDAVTGGGNALMTTAA